jgi:hypothetical protein
MGIVGQNRIRHSAPMPRRMVNREDDFMTGLSRISPSDMAQMSREGNP